jgi:hypothetical protein
VYGISKRIDCGTVLNRQPFPLRTNHGPSENLCRLSPHPFATDAKVKREHRENFIPIPDFDKSVSVGVSIQESHQGVCGDRNHSPLIVLGQNCSGGSIQLEHALRHRSSSFKSDEKRAKAKSLGLAIG